MAENFPLEDCSGGLECRRFRQSSIPEQLAEETMAEYFLMFPKNICISDRRVELWTVLSKD